MSERQGPGHGLSEHELSEIRMLIEERTGICFDESRERFFSTRVREHLRAKGLERGTDLLRCVRKSNVEYEALLEGLLTQETSFFRYPGVYEAFEKRVLPELHTKKFWKNPRTLRIWSAGCSTGEEPYSIAMTVAETLGASASFKLIASDIDTKVLATGQRGVYGAEARGLSSERLRRHFLRGKGANAGFIRVKPELARCIEFRTVNLMASSWPLGEPFDMVFCRNVMIYFDAPTQRRVLERMHAVMKPRSLLYVGHSENFTESRDLFRLRGKTIYERV